MGRHASTGYKSATTHHQPMSVVAAAAAGCAVGVTHALESDHVAAVATLVDEREGGGGNALVGASWGVGHSIPIAVIGLVFVALGVRLPDPVTALFEGLVGLLLLGLGAWLLAEVGGLRQHSHDGDDHTHLDLAGLSLGSGHRHVDGSSFLVGAVHGFAGSGALVVGMVTTAPTIGTSLAFLGAFAALSVLTMGTVSMLWGRTLGTDWTRPLKGVAAGVSLLVGATLLLETVLGVAVPLPGPL